MKSVLLTGATGYIGRWTVKTLMNHGYEIHAVSSRQIPETTAPGLTWHRADLLDPSAPAKLCAQLRPRFLLHFAWYVEYSKFWEDPSNSDWRIASQRLIDSFHKYGGCRAVGAGTCAETAYPTTRYAQEKRSLRNHLLGTGDNGAWGVIFHSYGPGEHEQRFVASVINHLLRNEAAPVKYGMQVRDFVFVKDLASAFVALLESDVLGTVDLGTGEARTLNDLVSSISRLMGKAELIDQDSSVTEGHHPLRLLPDTDRLNSEVGWQPEFSLHEGLTTTINWWQERCRRH